MKILFGNSVPVYDIVGKYPSSRCCMKKINNKMMFAIGFKKDDKKEIEFSLILRER